MDTDENERSPEPDTQRTDRARRPTATAAWERLRDWFMREPLPGAENGGRDGQSGKQSRKREGP